MFGLPLDELALLAAGLLAGGLITGFLAGLFGIGGGGVLVPILYEIFRLVGVDDNHRMHLAVGTSLAVIIPTSISSVRSHYKRGAVDVAVIKRMGAFVFMGVLLGIAVASLVEGAVLKAAYVLSTGFIATRLIAGGDRWRLGPDLPGRVTTASVSGVIGLLSTLIGIGGGAQVTAFMTLYGRPIHQAVATAAGFGPIIAIPAAIGYIAAGWDINSLPWGSLGYVSLLGLALVAPVSVWAAPIGVRAAHGLSRRTLELAFAAFLIAVCLRFLASLIV